MLFMYSAIKIVKSLGRFILPRLLVFVMGVTIGCGFDRYYPLLKVRVIVVSPIS